MKLLKSITVQNYRGFFEDGGSVAFAPPDSSKNGSGLTVIAGPNNTGKTSLIEALLLGDGLNITKPERHEDKTVHIEIIFTDDSGQERKQVINNNEHGSRTKRTGDELGKFIILEFINADRLWPHVSLSGKNYEKELGEFGSSTSSINIRMTEGELNNTMDRLTDFLTYIHDAPLLKTMMNEYMRRLVPHFTDWKIDTDGQNRSYIEYSTPNATHEVKFSGSGILSLFRICAHLIIPTKIGKVLILDEPEMSLHPYTQKVLLQILSEAAKSRQIIICTHSPHFLHWDDYENGAQFIRMNKKQDEKCTIAQLNPVSGYSSFLVNHLEDWQRPHLLDLTAKEIMFSDKMLFVEGPEDVGILKRWFAQNNLLFSFDIFGYGVGGHTNMKLFLNMARDLKLDKIAALYDGDTEARKSFKADKVEFNKCSYWHFAQLPTDDIRDKKDKTGKVIKEGCFNASGNIKEKYREAFSKCMRSIFKYFEDDFIP